MEGGVISVTGGTCSSSQAKTLTKIKRNVSRGRSVFSISCVQPGGKEKQLLRVLTVFSGFLSKSNDRLVFVHTF